MTKIDGADEDEPERAAGQLLIRRHWTSLSASTRNVVVQSGLYSQRGHRLQVEESLSADDESADLDRLEYALGVLSRCAAAKVPHRSEKGGIIPGAALTDEVLTQCEVLLLVPSWHDPVFLRLALSALATHQEADALTVIGSSGFIESHANGLLGSLLGVLNGLLKFVLICLMPAALAFGLVATFRHDVLSAGVAFYVMGAGILAAMSTRAGVKDRNLSTFERAHRAWFWFRFKRRGGAVGSGARFYLERMAKDGVDVPTVAFDLCSMLEYRMRAAAGELAIDGSKAG